MACFGSPISTRVACPLNARSSTCHWTGSVSWNSSTSTTFHRRRIRSRAGASVVLEGVGEPAEQVVVGQHAAAMLAALDLGAHVAGEVDLGGRRRTRLRVVRGEHGLRVTDRRACELERDRSLERRRLGRRAPALEEEVVGHLDHEVVEALHQLGARVGVTRDAERAQHQLAELVRGGDGGAVEAGERVDESACGGARRRH